MQLTLRRRYRLGLGAMLLVFVGSTIYAKRRMDEVELELTHERAAAKKQLEAVQLALDKARAEVETLQRFPRPDYVLRSAEPVMASAASIAMPTVRSPRGSASATLVPPLPHPQPTPSGGAAVEHLLRYIDARLLPPQDGLNVVVMGSKQMLHRDKQFYLDAFHGIGFGTIEIGDASNPMIPWQPSDPGWSGILCLSLTDGEDKCLHKNSYAGLKPYQRIGRLPGLRHTLWNKDSFCRTLKAVEAHADGPTGIVEPPVALDAFSFNCWVVPAQYDELMRWGSDPMHRDQKYIVKPLSAGEGIGIKLLDGLSATAPYGTMAQSHVIQPYASPLKTRYLSNPLLINGYKFDIRSYVLVTSVSPLRAYMYGDGLVRFASTAYKESGQDGADATSRTSFLTNTAVNKKSGKALSNLTWSFEQFRNYVAKQGKDVEQVFGAMHSVVAHMLLVAEPAFLEKWRQQAHEHSGQQLHCSQHCYHLLGVDIIFDDRWQPRVIEVNGEPSMKPAIHETQSSPYNMLKKHMTADLAAIVYGTPAQRLKISIVSATTSVSSSAVLTVSRQLAHHRVGVVGVDCDASMADSAETGSRAWLHWKKGERHDTCVGQDLLEYLLRSQREWTDRGAFYRIYPRPSQGDASGGDQLARLLGYIGLLYPDYASTTNMASTSSAVATASADGGVALQETSWMVHELLARIEGEREDSQPFVDRTER